MSDKDDKKKKEEIPEDRSTPDIINEGLVTWAERCFRGDEQAMYFFVHQLPGRTGKARGELLRKRPVSHLKGEGGVRREELIAVCNELMEEMQDEADQMRQPRRFVVTAHSALKGGEFAMKTVECEPKRLHVKGGDQEDGDADPFGSDVLRKRAEMVLQDGRFYAEHVTTSLGGIVQLLSEQLKGKDEQISRLFEMNMNLARQNNEAENNKLDRDLIRAEKEFILSAKKKGVGMIAGLLPDFLKKMTNGAVELPGGRTTESMVIESIMDEKNGGLTMEEKNKIFGLWTDAGERLEAGILTENQVRILVGLLNEKIPVTELDRVITEGSPDQLTMDQYKKIMMVLEGDMDKLMPLVKVLQDRKNELDKKKTETPPATQET